MGKYDDIIGLPHPVSKKHPPMPVEDRAVQFAPFAALNGYGAAVNEAERRIVLAGGGKIGFDEIYEIECGNDSACPLLYD